MKLTQKANNNATKPPQTNKQKTKQQKGRKGGVHQWRQVQGRSSRNRFSEQLFLTDFLTCNHILRETRPYFFEKHSLIAVKHVQHDPNVSSSVTVSQLQLVLKKTIRSSRLVIAPAAPCRRREIDFVSCLSLYRYVKNTWVGSCILVQNIPRNSSQLQSCTEPQQT